MKFSVILPGAPRTKKTSPRLMPLMTKQDVVDLLQALKQAVAAADHRAAISAIMKHVRLSVRPSEAHEEWFDAQILTRGHIRGALQKAGIPLRGPVQVSAKFYRERDTGDLIGYMQALADLIQEEQWACQQCGKKTYNLQGRCPHCAAAVINMRHSRQGLGIILDDAQVVSWDGSRLAIDKQNPRIEFTIETLAEMAAQEALF